MERREEEGEREKESRFRSQTVKPLKERKEGGKINEERK